LVRREAQHRSKSGHLHPGRPRVRRWRRTLRRKTHRARAVPHCPA